jgi:VanZ family protein
VAIIVLLSLVPGDERPHTGLAGGVEHALAYALTAIPLAIGHPSVRHRVVIALGLALLAAVLEVLQLALPGRVGDVSDVVASGLGGLAGLALVQALEFPARLRRT